MKSFEELGIAEPMLRIIEKEGFTEPTEIQEKTVPLIIEGKDVIAGSATGSGKTLAFASGIVKNTEKGRGVQALILTPTRELCNQVASEHRKYSRFKGLNVVEVFGGVSINPQIEGLRRADIIVATPGRMLDHLQRRTANLSRVKILVLDEADRMFDMGFIDDVEKIIRHCPKKRQTLLFSATVTEEVRRVSRNHMINPASVSAKTQVDPMDLKQVYYEVDKSSKFSLLVSLMKIEKESVVMVFCNSKRTVDFIEKNLNLHGIEAHAMHGGLTQARRTQVLRSFHSKKVHVLVCTDVAARGLDIKGVTHVYNYEIPNDPNEYVHRIGRTARAGKKGIAINILSREEGINFQRALMRNDSKALRVEVPSFEKIRVVKEERKPMRKQGGRQRSGGFERRERSGSPPRKIRRTSFFK